MMDYMRWTSSKLPLSTCLFVHQIQFNRCSEVHFDIQFYFIQYVLQTFKKLLPLEMSSN